MENKMETTIVYWGCIGVIWVCLSQYAPESRPWEPKRLLRKEVFRGLGFRV